MSTTTFVVGIVLAFLLFTSQGHLIAMSAIGPAIMAIFPPPQPTLAAHAPAPAPVAHTCSEFNPADPFNRIPIACPAQKP